MNPIQEMLLALYSNEVANQAAKQAKDKVEISSVKKYDMPLRLLRISDTTVNLEILINQPHGNMSTNEEGWRIGQMSSYFKPIGVYNFEGKGYLRVTTIKVPREFEPTLKNLILSGQIQDVNFYTSPFSLIDNALIATFSMEAVIEARAIKDVSFIVNGLKVDIFMTGDGFDDYPQAFLDDKYGISGPIAAYFIDGPTSLAPMMQYQTAFNNLYKQGLLSAYKAF